MYMKKIVYFKGNYNNCYYFCISNINSFKLFHRSGRKCGKRGCN